MCCYAISGAYVVSSLFIVRRGGACNVNSAGNGCNAYRYIRQRPKVLAKEFIQNDVSENVVASLGTSLSGGPRS